MPDQQSENHTEPAIAGIKGKCPRCGQGHLFQGFIKLRNACDQCGLNYDFADSGDGPAAFVILITGFIVVGLALWMEVTTNAPLWLHLVLWVPLTIILALTALRLIKGLLITYQYANKAAEGRLENRE